MLNRPCALDYAAQLRASLDRDDPAWTTEQVWCPQHQDWHTLTRDPGQMPMPAMDSRGAALAAMTQRRTVKGVLLPDGATLCFHGNTSPAVYGDCAYCGTRLHVHQDALAAVKSGKADAGYLEEKCPACHRANAVHPAYGMGGIRTAQLEGGAPAMQMKLIR